MAKKRTVFRVIGIIKAKEVLPLIEEVSKYAFGEKTKRLILAPRKQDNGKPVTEVKYMRLQVDFTDLQRARKCHYAVKGMFVEDHSDFLHLL